MIKDKFNGVYAVVPTPLLEDERLDLAGLRHLVEFYITSGCHGLVILGSGGEFPYFSFGERLEIARTAVEVAAGRVPVLLGAGFYSALEAAEFIESANHLGADGYLVAVPTYYAVAFDDLLSYLNQVTRAAHIPVFYYHFPVMTRLPLTTDQVDRVLAVPGVAGMKESTLCLPEIKRHLALPRAREAAIFAGHALRLLEVLESGGAGVIGVLPSIAPGVVRDCYNSSRAGDRVRAGELQQDILSLLPFLLSLSWPTMVQRAVFRVVSSLWFSSNGRVPSRQAVFKETLRQLGHPVTARVRSPLPQIQPAQQKAIAELIARHKRVLVSV